MTRFEATGRAIGESVDDELILLDVDEGSFFATGGVGPAVWQLLGAGSSVEEIAAEIVARYGIDAAQARADVERFAATLVERGWLREVASAG